jgi:hypothetical protein
MFCIEFFATRCWVSGFLDDLIDLYYLKLITIMYFSKISIWILIFTITMLAFESIFVINYVTRFTEEIFAILIACVFLADAIKKIIDVTRLFQYISLFILLTFNSKSHF